MSPGAGSRPRAVEAPGAGAGAGAGFGAGAGAGAGPGVGSGDGDGGGGSRAGVDGDRPGGGNPGGGTVSDSRPASARRAPTSTLGTAAVKVLRTRRSMNAIVSSVDSGTGVAMAPAESPGPADALVDWDAVKRATKKAQGGSTVPQRAPQVWLSCPPRWLWWPHCVPPYAPATPFSHASSTPLPGCTRVHPRPLLAPSFVEVENAGMSKVRRCRFSTPPPFPLPPSPSPILPHLLYSPASAVPSCLLLFIAPFELVVHPEPHACFGGTLEEAPSTCVPLSVHRGVDQKGGHTLHLQILGAESQVLCRQAVPGMPTVRAHVCTCGIFCGCMRVSV
jgi:hypothetical protein